MQGDLSSYPLPGAAAKPEDGEATPMIDEKSGRMTAWQRVSGRASSEARPVLGVPRMGLFIFMFIYKYEYPHL